MSQLEQISEEELQIMNAEIVKISLDRFLKVQLSALFGRDRTRTLLLSSLACFPGEIQCHDSVIPGSHQLFIILI